MRVIAGFTGIKGADRELCYCIYCDIMFEERCELIMEEILHPTFSFLSASATGSKLHKVYTVFER